MTFCHNLLISSTPAFTELITSSSVCLSVCPFACPSVVTFVYFCMCYDDQEQCNLVRSESL